MNKRIRRLFFLAVITAAGLLCLQVFWMYKEWNRSRDLLQRQIDYSFQQAVDKEWNGRKDTLAVYLSEFLHDTSFIRFGTKYNEKEKLWMNTVYDPANPKDYSAWSNKLHPAGERLSNEEREEVINRFIEEHLKKSIATDVIFFFTQRFGTVWTKKYDELKLDSTRLNQLFREELSSNHIQAEFSISYRDTTQTKFPEIKSDALSSKPLLVNKNQVNDLEKKYMAQATVSNPGLVILKRLWLIGTASLGLAFLTLWCLYRMYQTILRQKKLDELKDDFISNMTHELKTPIATVTAAIDGLQYYDGLNDQERTRRYLELSRKELNRLDGMVSKALELSIEQDIQLRRESIPLRPFLEQLLAGFDWQTGFSYTVSVSDELMLHADKELFQSLFRNIIENAIKYGKEKTAMHFSAERDGAILKISISDNGPGIDKAYLTFIFQKFYRAPGSNEVKGFGLGLYRVATIVRAHGGIITAANDNGLQLSIQLPTA